MSTKNNSNRVDYQNDNNYLSKRENYQNSNPTEGEAKDLEAKRGKNLKKEEIIQAIKILEDKNEKPSILKIYELLGRRGSYQTIAKVKKEYEQAKAEREMSLKENQIGKKEIMELSERIAETAYLANIEYVNEQLSYAQRTVAGIKSEAEAEIAEFMAKCELLESDNHQQSLEINSLKAKVKQYSELLEQYRQELINAKNQHTELTVKNQSLEQENFRLIEDLNQEKEARNTLLKEIVKNLKLQA